MTTMPSKHTIELHNDSSLPSPVSHALKKHALGSQLTNNTLKNQIATFNLLLFGQPDPRIWQDMLSMQQAVLKRIEQQQVEWAAGCNEILKEYNQIKDASTLSKLLEKEYNVVGQFVALTASQMTDWVGLIENFQISYSWWLNQQQNRIGQRNEALSVRSIKTIVPTS